jgi:hypothetical protein
LGELRWINATNMQDIGKIRPFISQLGIIKVVDYVLEYDYF